jgi:hypothetical protein
MKGAFHLPSGLAELSVEFVGVNGCAVWQDGFEGFLLALHKSLEARDVHIDV